jgi:ABC-2 type transport system ATP-binding protein
MVPILELKNLTKHFGRIEAVSDLNLILEKGEIFGFLGPNGAGKTTTIKMIAGLIRPTSGWIKINGYDVNRDHIPALQTVGLIIESPAFYDHLSARKNLELFGYLHGKIDSKRIDYLLELMGLDSRAQDKTAHYSTGMRQRLAIAAALLHHPKLVILDEPTSGLDPAGRREIRNLLPRLTQEEGITVFLSSHILPEVEQVCQRVGVINHGRLVAVGEVRDLISTKAKGQGDLEDLFFQLTEEREPPP